MVRALTGDSYDKVVRETKVGENGSNIYDWDVGIAP